jgi:hypothetical protein
MALGSCGVIAMGFYIVPTREQALANYYSAERRAGADPLTANGRMHEFAKRLDRLEYDIEIEVVRQCMERQL